MLLGCAAHKIEVENTSGFLSDYPGLDEGSEEPLGLVYKNPGLDLIPYKKVMIDHVALYQHLESEAKAAQSEQSLQQKRGRLFFFSMHLFPCSHERGLI